MKTQRIHNLQLKHKQLLERGLGIVVRVLGTINPFTWGYNRPTASPLGYLMK